MASTWRSIDYRRLTIKTIGTLKVRAKYGVPLLIDLTRCVSLKEGRESTLQNECYSSFHLRLSVNYLVKVAMLIVKKRSKALQEYISVKAGKAQTRLLFVV